MILLIVFSLLALVSAKPILNHHAVRLFEADLTQLSSYNSNTSTVLVLDNRDLSEEFSESNNRTTWTWKIKFSSSSRKSYKSTRLKIDLYDDSCKDSSQISNKTD